MPFSFIRDECVRLMTRNSTHSKSTVFRRGRICRFNMFSLPIGVDSFSEGNSQPSSPVSGEDESHSFRSCCSPGEIAARLTAFASSAHHVSLAHPLPNFNVAIFHPSTPQAKNFTDAQTANHS